METRPEIDEIQTRLDARVYLLECRIMQIEVASGIMNRKHYIQMAVSLALFVLMAWAAVSRADGDRIDPSIPISEQVDTRSFNDCRGPCYAKFDRKFDNNGFVGGVRNVPPEKYDYVNSQLWLCLKRCD